MATASATSGPPSTRAQTDRDMECAVCWEPYRDPRILRCGDHFCKVCLEQIADRHPEGSVPCPTCRHVTDTRGVAEVDNLPRYAVNGEFNRRVDDAEMDYVANIDLVGDCVSSMVVDSVRQTLIVRRNDSTEPVSVYDFQGWRQLSVLGRDIDGIAGEFQSIAIDTTRDLYLLPLSNGSLATMDMGGQVKDQIMVVDAPLHGVTYCDEDYYVTTSVTTHRVYMIDPNSKQMVGTFAPDTAFDSPYQVSYLQYNDAGRTTPAIVVADWARHCVKLLDYRGRLLHTYGTDGEEGVEEGKFFLPYSLGRYPGGRVIVGDSGSGRILAVGREEGRDVYTELAGHDHSEGDLSVAYHPQSKKLFVADGEFIDIHIFQG